MKDHYGIKVQPILNLCDYNVQPEDICWDKVKMTSSKWIACCHRTCDYHHPSMSTPHSSKTNTTSTRITNSFNTGSTSYHSPFNTFGGRRYKWSPSMSLDHSLLSIQSPRNHNQSPSNSSPVSFSSFTGSVVTDSQSSVHSNSSSNASSTHILLTQKSIPKRTNYNATNRYHDLQYPHHNDFKSKDDSMVRDYTSSYLQSIITLINPFEYLLVNCETNNDTNCAQISPEQEIIAVSNEYWLAFYSIRDNDCLGTVQFPNKCLFWTWINSDAVAIITENDVFHWSLDRPKHQDYPKLIFSLDEEIKQHQIINYAVDRLYGSWCALTSLYLDEDDEIGGKIQIYSLSYAQSQCIEAHSCLFVRYRFEGNSNDSNLLIAVKREKKDLWKLYIIELSSLPNGNFRNRPMKSQQLKSHGWHRTGVSGEQEEHEMLFDDIPTHMACDEEIGLIFIVSKYGSIYICDLESGSPLYYDFIKQWTNNVAIFSVSYDPKNTCLIVICRNGRVLVIKILLKQLLEYKSQQKFSSNNVYTRISEKLRNRKLSRMISTPSMDTRHNGDQFHKHHNININNNNNNVRTVSIMANTNRKKKQQQDEETSFPKATFELGPHSENSSENSSVLPIDETHSIGSYYDEDDGLEEEITRL